MGQSYRIRTELGITKTINVELTQEFEFLEILSLKLQQQDVYSRLCADYGVVVGRVTANNGLGIPNARVAIFVPIEQIDQSNPVISSIYPYNSPSDRNEDGYRYNLLPYEPSYTGHAATGTLPSRLDVLTGQTAVEIFDKYYKLTAKTNDSGDYMIMGVPLGEQTIVMDVDLSDIGEFSLTPQDLIRMGLATEAQVAGNRFRTSADLNSLPQIINLTKVVEVSPLWGEPAVCQIAINRVDFDLRNEANVDIQPTAVFMGSMYSTADQFRIRKGSRPRDDFGNLCGLTTGPGQIIALRQTIQVDLSGNPILEVYEIEKNGNVIDGDGTWLIELPMNLNYIVTNEFGERIVSYDPTIGIPTKAKYRFKIKWEQPPTLTQQVRRAYYLVPNIREFGWTVPSFDPNFSTVTNLELRSSYYFGLDWSGYTEGLSASQASQKIDEIINCEDTFYEFDYNRVYTVAGLIDQYKNGGRGRFIGIKEIDSQECQDTVNKFPVNEGFKNFDFLFFIVSILLQVLQLLGPPLIVVASIFAWFWNNVLVPFKEFFTGLLSALASYYTIQAVRYGIQFITFRARQAVSAGLCAAGVISECFNEAEYSARASEARDKARQYARQAAIWGGALISFELIMRAVNRQKFPPIKLPSITYPTCLSCDCSGEDLDSGDSSSKYSILSRFSNPSSYVEKLLQSSLLSGFSTEDKDVLASAISRVIGTNTFDEENTLGYKAMYVDDIFLSNGDEYFAYSDDLPLAERINLFNQRKKYFDGVNRISVSFDHQANAGVEHFDNTLTLIFDTPIPSGTLLTFVNQTLSNDTNYTVSIPNSSYPTGISGTTLNPGPSQYIVNYATGQQQESNRIYNLSTGSTLNNYNYPADIEYFQVLTAITISQASQIWNLSNSESLPSILESSMVIKWNIKPQGLLTSWGSINFYPPLKFADYFENFDNQYIIIMQRGVDPYSPIFKNKYGIGKLLGFGNENDFTIEVSSRLNIPIQKLNSSSTSVQLFNQQNNIFYKSHFFEPGNDFVSFNTRAVGYYGLYDASVSPPLTLTSTISGVRGLFSVTYNGAFDFLNVNPTGRYNQNEDISSEAYYFVDDGNKPNNTSVDYYTKVLKPTIDANPLSISDKTLNIMRTDRIPSSDSLDGNTWDSNPSIGQQNLAFSLYQYFISGDVIQVAGVGSGAEVIPFDISGQTASINIFNTFECSNLVPFACYTNQGTSFGVNPNCPTKDIIQNGCYVILEKPLTGIRQDIRSFQEWAYRFRFFYGLCRGVLSQSFTNNWINGSLFTFPIQVDTTYDSSNRPKYPVFEKKLIYFDETTNNFYYRSSPFIRNYNPSEFIGRSTISDVEALNNRNLLFPTTITNLGMKANFFGEIIYEPSTNAYIMQNLNSTSYNDTSDLVNLFVISRIADNNFLNRFNFLSRDRAINQFFTRNGFSVITSPKARVDADLAQLFSINSEFGVIGFSPEFYPISSTGTNPVVLLYQGNTNPVMGIFYSSTTFDLQDKDFLSPGIINFRPNPSVPAITYPYGIKSQKVPFYQWQLNPPPVQFSIFGNVTNNWATNISDIVTSPYQSLNRRNLTTPNYFVPSNTSFDIYQRGYIFNVNASGDYDFNTWGSMQSKFLVGAPNQFYFGIKKGNSALDKFKTKYLPNE